jgi:outer membrane protein OmpA-like peptidoglycan-associated protein
MKTSVGAIGFFCFIAFLLMAGCQTLPDISGWSVPPVVPGEDELIIRDQLIILVDATGSIGSNRVFTYEKALVQAFTGAMPEGDYKAGITSFSGVSETNWLKLPLAVYDRDAMNFAAAKLEPLGLSTPLSDALLSLKPELEGQMGRGAILVFSDGEVTDPEAVLHACQDLKMAHRTQLCIFTVHVGHGNRGKPLLENMAKVNGCGKYYDGASLNSAAAIQALVRDIFLAPKEFPVPAPQPAAWTLKIINFDNDSAVVAAQYDVPLDEAAAILKANPDIGLRLEGHTDSNASAVYNQTLSERRVEAVKSALVKRGVDASRLETGAYGKTRPAVPNDSPENRHKNRRVELSVITQ